MSSQGTEVSKIANQATVFLSQGSEPLYKQKNNKCCLFNLVEHHIQQPFQSYTIFSCKSSGRCCSRCSNPPTLPLTKGPPLGGTAANFPFTLCFFFQTPNPKLQCILLHSTSRILQIRTHIFCHTTQGPWGALLQWFPLMFCFCF